MNSNHTMLFSTVGGTLFSIVPRLVVTNILVSDMVKTAFLAAVGATVSFIISLVLRYVLRKFTK